MSYKRGWVVGSLKSGKWMVDESTSKSPTPPLSRALLTLIAEILPSILNQNSYYREQVVLLLIELTCLVNCLKHTETREQDLSH